MWVNGALGNFFPTPENIYFSRSPTARNNSNSNEKYARGFKYYMLQRVSRESTTARCGGKKLIPTQIHTNCNKIIRRKKQ